MAVCARVDRDVQHRRLPPRRDRVQYADREGAEVGLVAEHDPLQFRRVGEHDLVDPDLAPPAPVPIDDLDPGLLPGELGTSKCSSLIRLLSCPVAGRRPCAVHEQVDARLAGMVPPPMRKRTKSRSIVNSPLVSVPR